MKNLKSTISPLIFIALLQALTFPNIRAQGTLGTGDDGFLIQINSPASIAQTIEHGFDPDICQWIGQSGWGADVTEEFCGEVVWADDSLGCTPLVNGNSLAGKIALVRRGSCSFSLKTYHAQQAGAIAVIIINHYNNPQDGPCTTYANATQFLGGMTPVDSASAIHIPAVFLERMTGEDIQGALDAGQTVNVCFTFPSSLQAFGPYAYGTPASQVDTLNHIALFFVNRESTPLTDLVVKADIKGPNGYSYSYTTSAPEIAPAEEVLIFMDGYLPPAVAGEYEITLTNNKYHNSQDSLTRKFAITEFTFSTDNLELQLDGGADRNDLFVTGDKAFTYQIGGLSLTGANGAVATHVTFGIANIDSIYSGNPSSDIIGVLLFDGDADEDGTINLMATGGSWDDISSDLVGYANYELKGTETEDGLIDIKLEEINNGGPVTLKPYHPYYTTIVYDGINNGSGRNVALSNSSFEDYLVFPTVAMHLGQFYNAAWGDRSVVHRLQLQGYIPFINTAEPKTLAASKVLVNPNPANEFVNLELKLDAVNPTVAVSILDGKGRTVVGTKVEKNIQNGVMTFNVNTLPSGVYYLWLRTAEGATFKKVVVTH
ncbi:MAG: PA domain-containing protein [Saprospiraceae bacterium]